MKTMYRSRGQLTEIPNTLDVLIACWSLAEDNRFIAEVRTWHLDS